MSNNFSLSEISKNEVKRIRALHLKKNRQLSGFFIAEGVKIVEEALASSFNVTKVIALEKWFEENRNNENLKDVSCFSATEKTLSQLSQLNTANEVLAVLEIPQFEVDLEAKMGLNLVFDDIRNPSNLGAVIRIADWFGLKEIYCSKESAECFNSKVVQASMGSVFRVKVNYCDLKILFNENEKTPIFGALLDGLPLKNNKNPLSFFLLMGNESKGVCAELRTKISHPIAIRQYGNAESLNLSVATGILVNHFKMNEI